MSVAIAMVVVMAHASIQLEVITVPLTVAMLFKLQKVCITMLYNKCLYYFR